MLNKNIIDVNYDIIGRDINNSIIKELIESYVYERKEIKEYKYLKFKENGFCLCFKNDLLECVFLYNQGVENYNKFSFNLPYKLVWSYTNKTIVEIFGDTKVKQGGNVPLWLSYPHLGIEFTFLGKSWSDINNPIIFITLFNKEIDNSKFICCVCLKEVKDNKPNTCPNDCHLVNYCSIACKDNHLNFHLKYCNK
jgi:hypothetical protein